MTTKINYVNSQIRNGEMSSLAAGINSKKALLSESTDPHLWAVVGRVGTAFEGLNAAFDEKRVKSSRTSLLGEEVLAFRSLHQLVKGYAGLQSASVSWAAKQTLEVLDGYVNKITQRRGQKEVHAHVSSLLGDLDSASMQTLIPSMMYCDGAVAKLKEVHTSYLEQYTAYRTARDKQVAGRSASVLTKELLQLINSELVDYLNAMSRVATVDHSEFAASVAALITEHNIISKTRKTRAKNAAATTAEPEKESEE
ncbi:MAG: DUF6261 family protein [Mangrovibacterium sp.]